MVNRRTKYAPTMQIVRRVARKRGYSVAEESGRGKGSHRHHVVLDGSGAVVGRFVLTDHPRELSWVVLRNVENDLAPLFGEKWMENG
ncbi:hypothetical protein [Pseudonocardia phyllosphaerae]|uniref:hypothetical protein n=1 Tax=Pseudonocardia phyllosphaerae TaxID=3390502 RepID=UPI00397E62A6